MNYTVIEIIVLIFNFIISTIFFGVALDAEKYEFNISTLIVFLGLFVPPISLFILLYFWEFDTYISLYTVTLCSVTLVHILFVLGSVIGKDWSINIILVLFFGLCFYFIVITPITIYNELDKENTLKTEEIDVSEIENSFIKIKENMTNLEENVKKEVADVSILSKDILKQINIKKIQLEEIEKRQVFLQKEVDYYKSLSNVSKKDAELILETVRLTQGKDKYFEYFLGFVIGILTGIISNFIYKRLDNILSAVNNKK